MPGRLASRATNSKQMCDAAQLYPVFLPESLARQAWGANHNLAHAFLFGPLEWLWRTLTSGERARCDAGPDPR